MTDRVEGGDGLPPHANGPGTEGQRVDEAHLDDLINEHSAADADLLDEQERAQMAALAAAPLRAVSSSPARVVAALRGGTRAVGSVLGGVGAAGVATVRAGAGAVGAARGRLAARAAARRPSHRADVTRPVRRPARRLGLAALTALAVAAPAAAAPAPWGALVGASVGDNRRVLGGGIPDDLFSPNALGPLPATLPQRGLSGVPTAALGTTANPEAAGLPLGGADKSIPSTVLLAYQKAADRLAVENPGCHLSWSLLAGIGKVESNHARGWNGNDRLTSAGDASPPILGPVLDGSLPGTARLADTDRGLLDGNAQFDRAVGPMQFVPGTWKLLNKDGNGDGNPNPNNIWDATLAAGSYLCEAGGDLSRPSAQAAAVFAYNPSVEYVTTVLAWARAYASGAEVDLSTPIAGIGNLPGVFAEPPGFSIPLQQPYTGAIYPGFPIDTGGSGGGFGPVGPGFTGGFPTGGLPTGGGSTAGGSTAGGSTGGTPNSPKPNPPKPNPPTTSNPPRGQQPPPAPTPQNPKPPTPQNPKPPTEPVLPQPLAVTLTSVTAVRTPAEPTTGKPATSVGVTAKIDASKAGNAQIVLTLAGAKDVQLTRVEQVKVVKGANTVEFDAIDGGFFGDVGVDGPFSATLTAQETDGTGKTTASKASALGTKQIGPDWKASEFEGYRPTPTIEDISGRVDEFATAKTVSAAAKSRLDADLQAGDLETFRTHLRQLAGDEQVGAEAEIRLDRLAERRLRPEATPPTP